ncbi:MAG: signal peptidase I [Deltaproteobacteria bacterium]|nr:signal peptidase I [Deltaproteobacteria bacterium]
MRNIRHISRDLIIAVVISLPLTLCIKVYLVQAFRISSNSMAPALLQGDHLLVNKLGLFMDDPARGDVVIFNIARDQGKLYPLELRPAAEHVQLVKRVIGMPGDVVEIREGRVYVNGVPEDIEDTSEVIASSKGERAIVQQASLLNSSYRLLKSDGVGNWPSERIVIKPGRYFFLGDNRGWSYDSRHFGTVRREDIIGKAWLVTFSVDPESSSVLWKRMGHAVR